MAFVAVANPVYKEESSNGHDSLPDLTHWTQNVSETSVHRSHATGGFRKTNNVLLKRLTLVSRSSGDLEAFTIPSTTMHGKSSTSLY